MATAIADLSRHADMNNPNIGAELIARAQAMVPTLRERAADDDKAGFTSKQSFKEFKEAGITRVLQPRRWGGFEQPLSVFAQIAVAIGTADQSASWSYGITQGHAHHLSMFDDRAQRDVWGDNPEVLIASPYNPYGKAVTKGDGYVLSGQWPFSSACDHSEWFLLGAFADGDESKFLTLLVPGKDVEIIDDWDVFGLKATGSKSVRVKESYIPKYRTVPFGPGTEDFEFPGFAANPNPSLRIPYILVFNRLVTGTSIGGLGGMIDAVTEYLLPKMSVITGKPVSEHPDTLLALGEAKATFEELVILALHDLDTLEALAKAGKIPDEAEINLYRYRAQSAGERAAQAARRLFEESGGGALYAKSPIGRIFRNIMAARNHPATNMFRDSARAIGTNLFGRAAETRRRF